MTGTGKRAALTVKRRWAAVAVGARGVGCAGDAGVQWGAGASSLSRAASKLQGEVTLSSFLLPYSDAGLFGVYVQARPQKLAAAATAAADLLKQVRTHRDCGAHAEGGGGKH